MFDTSRLSANVIHLPLPLAQTLRRALNAKSPQEAHTAAYYFFECALKLSASAQIGVYVSMGCTEPALNELIENITRASTGHWLAILREVSSWLNKRPDKSLTPLADVNDRLVKKEPRPAARAFLDFVVKITEKPDGRKSLNVLDLFDAIVNYRNQELGHGAMRSRDFYAEAAPLLIDAALEAVNVLRPLGELQLSVARDVVDHRSSKARRVYQRLSGDGIQAPVAGVTLDERDDKIEAGCIVLVAGAQRVLLHPLVVYEVDELERERVGFVNLVSAKRVAVGTQMIKRQADGTIKRDTTRIAVKRVEYLDYDSGARIEGQDATEELAALLTRLKGTRVTADSVDKAAGEAEPNVAQPTSGIGGAVKGGGTGEYIGDFEILEELGRGGMGVVYKARQASLGRIVALKVLPPALAGDPVAVTRFKREVAALGRCDHPNVVKVLTAGQDGDRYYYAMEYVEGCDLMGVFGVMSQWKTLSGGQFKEGHLLAALSNNLQSRKDSPPTSPEAASHQALPEAPHAVPVMPQLNEGVDYYVRISQILADAARGVQHLHEHGIIHRDLKPANIMLTSDGRRAIVMDLGLAQVAGQQGLSVTRGAQHIVGTLRYMPPEQLQRHLLEITNKADVYSLGATLYELACLAPIFDADTEPALIQQVLLSAPKAPKSVNPSVPTDLSTIINVATAKPPNERYQSAEAFAKDLAAFSRGEPISVRPPGALHYLKLFYRKNRGMVHTAAAAVLLLIALTAWFVVNLGNEKAAAERARDEAEMAGREALRQKGIAEGQTKIAIEEKQKAEDARAAAEKAEGVAKTERDNAKREKEHAEKMEAKATTEADRAEKEAKNAKAQEVEAKRQAELAEAAANRAKEAERQAKIRFAEGLVLQADALVKANQHELALATYRQALGQARELGIDTFPAESGLALVRQQTPSPTTFIEAQPFQYLEYASLAQNGKVALLRHSSGLTLWDVEGWKKLKTISLGARRRGDVALAPNGTLAACGINTEVCVYNMIDGVEVTHFSPADVLVTSLAFSPDGKYLAVGTINGGLFEYSTSDYKLERKFEGTELEVRSLDYSPDGAVLAAGGAACKIWLFKPGETKAYQTIPAHEKCVFSLAFAPDNKTLASGGFEGVVCLWDLATLKRRDVKLFGATVICIDFSDDAKRLVFGEFAGYVAICDVESGKVIKSFQGHHGSVVAAGFAEGGNDVITIGKNDCPRRFSESGVQKKFLAGHHNVANSMALSNDGRTAIAVSYGEGAVVWDTVTGAELRRFGGVLYSMVRMDVSEDFTYAFIWGNDGRSSIWEIATGTPLRSIPERKQSIIWASLSKDGTRAAISLADGSIELWNMVSTKLMFIIPKRPELADKVDLFRDATRLAVLYRGFGIVVYDLTATAAKERSSIWGSFLCVSFLGDGSRFVTGDTQRNAQVWSVETRDIQARLNGHEGVIWELAASEDGSRVATYSQDCTLRVWDTVTGNCRLVCPGPDFGVKACAISGDASTVALSGMDASLRIWSTQEAVEIRALGGHLGKVCWVVASPEGRFSVTAATDGEIRLWDLNTGICLRNISAHNGRISALLLPTSDGRICISAGYDAQIKVWDLATGECLRTFSEHKGAVYAMTILPDGKTVVSGGNEHRVLMWDWETLKVAKEVVTTEKVYALGYWKQEDLLYIAEASRKTRFYSRKYGTTGFEEGLYSTTVNAISFSRDGNYFAVSGWARNCVVFSAQTGRPLYDVTGHTDSLAWCDFTADSKYLVTGGDDGTIRYWDVTNGKQLRVVPHAKFRDGMFTFSTDGQRLLFCGDEWSWHMWDLGRSALHDTLPAQAAQARQTLQFSPNDGPALFTLCRWYAFRGEMERAHELLLRAEKAAQRFEPGFVMEVCWQTNDLERAKAAFDELVNGGSLSEIARIYLNHGLAESFERRATKFYWDAKYDKALADFNTAAGIDPKFARPIIGRGDCHFMLKAYDKSVAEYDLALALEPRNVRALGARCGAYIELKQFEKALADALALCDLEPWSAYRRQRAGEIRCDLADFAAAEKEFTKALDLDKTYANAWYWRGWARQKQSRTEDALKDYAQYIALQPEVAAGYATRGDYYRELKRWKDAIADYDAAIRLADNVFNYYQARADAKVRVAEYVGAVADFRKALECDGADKAGIHYNLACAYSIWAKSLPAGEERWAIDKALDALEEAVKQGYKEFDYMKTDADLDFIRTEPRYLKLIEGK